MVEPNGDKSRKFWIFLTRRVEGAPPKFYSAHEAKEDADELAAAQNELAIVERRPFHYWVVEMTDELRRQWNSEG